MYTDWTTNYLGDFLPKIALMGSVMAIAKSMAPSMKVMLLRASSKYPVTTL